MKSKITLSILSVLLTLFLGAQQDVTFTVTDGGSGDAIEGATVTLDGQQQTTDIAGESVFNGIADGGYAYTVTSPCFEDYSGTINVAGAPLGEAVTLTAKTVNNVNIFVNSGGAAVGGAELNFDDGNGNSFDITSQPFGSGTMTNDVPYGTYNYTATVDCYTIAAGTFVVDCNTEATVEVNVEALPTTTHNAEISIGNPTYEGANVRIRNFATGFDQTYVSGATPEIVSDLAYGNYSISVEQACYETVYHNFTIDCNSDANMVIETPTFEPKVDNDVRFYVQENGTNMAGADILLTDGNGNDFTGVSSKYSSGKTFYSVPYGDYTYTITKACYPDVTGSVTVDCNGDARIELTEAMTPNTTHDVQFNIGTGGTAYIGANIELKGDNNYLQTFVTSDPAGGEILSGVPYGNYTYTISESCHETVTGSFTLDCNSPAVVSVDNDDLVVTVDNEVKFTVKNANNRGIVDANITLTDGGTYTESMLTTSSGATFDAVPFGTYSYTIDAACHTQVTGTVTVDCNGDAQITVDELPTQTSSHSIEFTVGNPAVSGASVRLSNNTGFYQNFTSTGTEIIADAPYGEYSYTVTMACQEDVTGTFTIDCNSPATIQIETADLQASTTNSVFWTVGSPLAIVGAEITLSDGAGFSMTMETWSPFGGDVMENVPFGDYTYTITKDCYETITGNLTVDCNGGQGHNVFEGNFVEKTMNDVILYLGFPMAFTGATVTITDGNGYNHSWDTWDPFGGEIVSDVPYGDYTYTIEKDCYETVTGTFTVDCNGGNLVEINEGTPAMLTSNDVIFYIGSPMAFVGATVTITDGNGYNHSWDTWDPFGGEIVSNVPYGDYTYTIEKACHETVTGSFTVDCNAGQLVQVFEGTPAMKTTNDVIFFIGSPMAFVGATVTITDGNGYNHSWDTWDPFGGEIVADVPYGDYTYTIEKDCHQTITGSFTVDCNNDQLIEVYEGTPAQANDNGVQFNLGVTEVLLNATITLTDGNGYSESLVTSDPMGGEIISNVPFGDYTYTIEKSCYETITGSVTVECIDGTPIEVNEGDMTQIVIDNTVTVDGNILTANAIGVGITYQWVDCDNANAEIQGATGQTFTATETGNYAVKIVDRNCQKISNCIPVSTAGIENATALTGISTYPNPATSNITIDFGQELSDVTIQVVDLAGKTVYTATENGVNTHMINITDLPSGTYVLNITSSNGNNTSLFVKQ